MATVISQESLVQHPAHSEGPTRVCFSADGKHIFTGGTDNYLRVYDATDERGEVEAAICTPYTAPDAEVISIDCSPAGDILVAGSDNTVALLERNAPHALKDLVTRCNLSPRDARFNSSGTKCAVTSDELTVKLIDVRDTLKIETLTGHTKAVRAVSWHPDGTLLTTSSSDGTIRAWDLTASEPLCIKVMDGVIPVEEPECTERCAAVWHPQGSYFVAATRAHEIAVIQRDTWSRIATFSTDGHSSGIVALAWSANGNYLVSAGSDRQVIVWDATTRLPVTKTQLEEGNDITELAWRPGTGSNAIAIVTGFGNLFRWNQVISSDRPHPSDIPRAAPVAAPRERSVSLAPSRGRRLDEDLGDADSLIGGDEDDWLIDDLDNAPAPGRKGINAPFAPPRSTFAAPAPRAKGQPAFQPGSTSWKEKRRYLAFNDVGVVHVVDREDYHVVTIDFHDQGAHRGYHFEDYNRFSMASLGANGALFANDEDMIMYRPYETWTDTNGEWIVKLPKDEKPVALAMGPKVGAVATSAGYLRFLSSAGLQTHLVDFGRDVVCLTMGSEFGMVVHRANAYAADDVAYTVFDLETYEIVQQASLPMMGDVTLKWVGFTEDEMPAIYKSNGVLSVLDRCRRPWQARWTPILDTRLVPVEGKQSYWPVWTTSTQLHHVILKGEDKQPSFPTPLVFAVDYKTPSLGQDSAQGAIEDQILRGRVMSTHLRDGAAPEDDEAQRELTTAEVALDKELLKLMQMACKADKLETALDAARLITHPASLEAAIKLANFFRLGGLEQRVVRLRDHRDGPQQPEKRDSRWAPLADERTISAPVQREGASARTAIDLLATPFESERRARGVTARPVERPARAAPVAQAAPPMRRNDDSGVGSSEAEPIPYDEDDEDETGAMDVDETPAMSAPPPAPVPTRNLFAKKAKPAVPPPASTAGSTRKGPISSAALKKSDSFFVRVEAEQAQQEQLSKGPRQAILFGSKPPEPAQAKKSNRGRKRKSDESSGGKEADDEASKKDKAPKQTLKGLFARAASKSSIPPSGEVTPINEDEDETQVQETQFVESPQSMKRARLDEDEPLPDSLSAEVAA